MMEIRPDFAAGRAQSGGASMKQARKFRCMPHLVEAVDDPQDLFETFRWQARVRHQGAVLSVDIAPLDAARP
jgi:hypothetical protein